MKELQKQPNTRNPSEVTVAEFMMHQGFRVFSRGWPDFLAIREDGVVLFVEVKRDNQETTETTGEQDVVLEILGRVFRQEVSPTFMVIRPKDLEILSLAIHLCEREAMESKDRDETRPSSQTVKPESELSANSMPLFVGKPN